MSRKHQRRKATPFAKLERQARELVPNLSIVTNPPGIKKMSEALEELIEPFMDAADSQHALKNMVALGVMAWNGEVTGKEGAKMLFKLRADMTRGQSQEDRKMINDVLDDLCAQAAALPGRQAPDCKL